MAEISDAKLERLIDEFLTKMPGGLSARFISYYINWAGLLTDDEWCLPATVNRFWDKNNKNNKYEKHWDTSVNGNIITYWTLKDEYKLVIPEVLVNEIISPVLLKLDLLKGFSNTTNAEVIDRYIDKEVDQLNSAEINKLYSYLYPASLDLMDEEKKIMVAKNL